MLIDPQLVEEAIISLVSPFVSVPVESFPDVGSIEEYRDSIASAKGSVLVAIPRMNKGSNTEQSGIYAFDVQFNIFVSSFKSLNGHAGVYQIVKSIIDVVDDRILYVDDHPCRIRCFDAYFADRDSDLYHYIIDTQVRPKMYRP